MKSADPWRAVADPTRRRVIELLRDGPKTTGALCRSFSTTRFAVMKHLAVLERAGIVLVRKAGRQRWNTLDAGQLRRLDEHWDWTAPDKLAEPGRVERRALPGRAGEAGPPGPPRDSVGQGLHSLPAPSAVEGSPALLVHCFIDSPPWRVFDALTVNVAAWWGAPHLCLPEASNLVIEPQPGGRFVEEWGHRQGTLRGQVTAIRQDERLELTGTVLGSRHGVLDIRLERREGGTGLRASLRLEPGSWASGGDERAALDDLLGKRLKAFVEQGTRSGVSS